MVPGITIGRRNFVCRTPLSMYVPLAAFSLPAVIDKLAISHENDIVMEYVRSDAKTDLIN